jgi:hypothetical protein
MNAVATSLPRGAATGTVSPPFGSRFSQPRRPDTLHERQSVCAGGADDDDITAVDMITSPGQSPDIVHRMRRKTVLTTTTRRWRDCAVVFADYDGQRGAKRGRRSSCQ